MENRSSQLGVLGLLAAAWSALMFMLCILACPATASADDLKPMAHAEADSSITFTSPANAVEYSAQNGGATVVMDEEWTLSGRLEVPEGKKVTINMNGLRIVGDQDMAFLVKNGGELTLTSNKKATLTYTGYNGQEGSEGSYSTYNGGLVSDKHGKMPAIKASDGATVTLDGITVAGCNSSATSYGAEQSNDAGAVHLSSRSTFNMKNGAKMEHNKQYSGGGIYVGGSKVVINIDNSSISDNYVERQGGGIYIGGASSTINMASGARISSNSAAAGGGIGFYGHKFTLKGDGTATIDNNSARASSRTELKTLQSGGGIHIANEEDGSGSIEGVEVSNNYSDYDGGGLEVDEQNVTIKNCTIKNNSCQYEGGGIYVCNDGTTIDGCTITGNYCRGGASTGNYEGGGVFVWHSYDLKLAGKCIIKGNTRSEGGSADDVFLRENAGATAKAYITGSLEAGSTVGVRTGIEGDRRIAKNFKPDTKDCLFYDMDGYYVSYGTDEGGDAWQRHRSLDFLLKVNGSDFNRYKGGSTVAVSAPAVSGKEFWHWDAGSTSGLYPAEDYINGGNMYGSVLAFKMPQNDASVGAVYAVTTKRLKLSVAAPVAGEALPATAEISSVEDPSLKATVPLTWREEDGNAAVSGIAKPNTGYRATASCTNLRKAGIAGYSFSDEGDLTLINPSTGKAYDSGAVRVDSVVSDSATETFSVIAAGFETGEGKSAEYVSSPVKVSLQAEKLSDIAAGASGGISLASLSDEGNAQSDSDSLGSLEISYTEGAGSVTIAAPVKENYNFNHWEGVPDGVEYDDTDGYVTIPADKLANLELTAVYTPVVTEVEVGLSAPEATESLDQKVSKLLLKASDGEQVDLVEELGELPAAWSPEGLEGGTADFSTAYSALVQICDGRGFVGVDKVLAPNAVVSVNDGAKAASAGFAIADGKLCLALSFDETRCVEATSVSQPKDIELTFEEAKACAEKGEWQLPKTAEVVLENDGIAEGDIEWQAVEGFDANAAGAQELTVKGEITHFSYVDKADYSKVSTDVTCTVKIAAPSQGGGEDGGETPAADTDDGNGQPAAGDADNKSALAKTGDSVPVLASAAVAAVAVIAIAAAAVAALRRRQ